MFPPRMFDDDEKDQEGRTPPPLLILTDLTYTASDWVVVYRFFLGPLDGHFTLYLGHLDQLRPEEAEAKANDPASPLLARARLALLRAVQLEVRH